MSTVAITARLANATLRMKAILMLRGSPWGTTIESKEPGVQAGAVAPAWVQVMSATR
ncbi:hypothetical protein [Pseudoxanthomonas sp. JBR18]|uniref:hypothetical protein n=1 Tax=Pseudoxanthomonas sp. JBR18 TaxID=2969308 RepID=UPI002306AF16|nr:hypothetical protein [Pseudoxanthomonas sp. JBR18]WCE03075.1 hypothetical protein PJ250_13195 [Pseudoxanthomonas sp. JBR18]